MSETPARQVMGLEETTDHGQSPSPHKVAFNLPGRRISPVELVQAEQQFWSEQPKNKLAASDNSGADANGANLPTANEDTSSKLAAKDIVDIENTGTADPGPPPSPPRASPLDRGRGGLPADGKAWRNFPANQKGVRLHCWANGIDHAAINILDSTESFLLADGEKKIEEKIDTRTPNTTIFTFNKEDHTLANLLRDKLLKNSHVTFAAYRIPHPLFANFELRVQTDGEITPKEAVLASSRDLVQDLNNLKTNFTREYELRKMVGGAQNGQ
ncbi:hypothetical protein G647_01297 [Cladophialophora carrionii CBS 160.54]|uniref:DNA-directed RNA polymerase RBP11-like dimerisation domain-containing protein n=1 Tax=Cladophialophora carrionii CBS 160.54 TaxID=1279043 RepID=V9DPN1_9EURO|nr:uncharacterized protein G647_01297 [Cladophialophora carrionii CBS 160.54]ETI28845.1 hypothetical protein G647_01297 [Cladophialophora carrionii CBS 160.54]